MALQVGTRLGPYEVLALIGAGGMGEVYRARDTRLGREVAIKVLPADRVADADRRRRFVQEAQAASALNHPHIITIYEIESADGNDFIVMEYVRGKSLDALIPRQGMRLNEALRIGIAVADALAAAHARGIVHRDLKPANVMVGLDRTVKVVDFGLAKLLADDDELEEQAVTQLTAPAISVPGTIAGTAAYMSPEQARGERLDARSDVFSFGAMLYEMATGVRAFGGSSAADTLTTVVGGQPTRPSDVNGGIPSDLEKVILRCLRKHPERRFQHIADVKVALQEIEEQSESGPQLPTPSGRARRVSRGLIAVTIAGVIVTSVIAVVATLWFRRPADIRSSAPSPVRLVQLTAVRGLTISPAFSPDGAQVAFSWNGEREDNFDIYLKIIGLSEVRRLTTDSGPDVNPAWSPDGRQIAFVRQHPDAQGVGTIHLVSPLGGADRTLSDFRVPITWPPDSCPIAWSPDGRWLAASGETSDDSAADNPGIHLIPATGGAARALTHPTRGVWHVAPAFSPDGHRLAYASCDPGMRASAPACDVYVVEVGAGYVPAASPRRLTKQGFAIQGLAWSRDAASIVYDTSGRGPFYLWRVMADGMHAPERLEVAGFGSRKPATVPSRDRLVFERKLPTLGVYKVWPGHTPQPVLVSSVFDFFPQFSPDGRRLAFASRRSGDTVEIWTASTDGSSPYQLTHGPGAYQSAPAWSPDGRRIAFSTLDESGHWDVWLMDSDGGSPRQLTAGPADEQMPTWSRDGRWIYFSSDRGGRRDIWRTAVSGGPGERVTIGGSGYGGYESPDGKTIVYQAADSDSPLLALPLAGGPARQLVGCVKGQAFAMAVSGVYYAPCNIGPESIVHLLEPATGRDRVLASVTAPFVPGNLAVSPDGRTMLVQRYTENADLMLLENFQ